MKSKQRYIGKTIARLWLLLAVALASSSAGQESSRLKGVLQAQAAARARAGGQLQDWLGLKIPGEQQQQQEQQQQYRCADHCDCPLVQVARPGGLTITNVSVTRCRSALFTDLLTIDRRTQIIHISLPDEPASRPAADPARFRMPRLVQFGQLREIVIVNLRFEVCDSEVFKRGQRLRRLQLNRNRLARLTKACLRHLERLIELNLDHNSLAELESALFSSLLNLRSLSIAHNQLSELAAHQFANLTYLSSLNLQGNSFRTINLHLFEPMQNSLRLLLLANNQIKSFAYTPTLQPAGLLNLTAAKTRQPLQGVAFRKLIKLNVDDNRLERIKALQLHRFYNVKFLSIRKNQIVSIRDKAFNGLKLIELSLAQNGLQSLSRCAFCNTTIKRLVLSDNNITLAAPGLLLGDPVPQPHALVSEQPAPVEPAPDTSASSSQNMLILSQSILGPLFGQLEYLDLSRNEQLGEQLEPLLEPLLKLEYLKLADVGLDKMLPSPTLFKNLRQLRYLNLSHNQLDQLIAETIEPLNQLQVLDLSYNKFNELDESFLVTVDERSSLRLLNLANNPWFCSQCKVAPLYDWILRSAIYNASCIAAAGLANSDSTDEQEADEDQQEPPTDGAWLAMSAQDDKTVEETLLDFDLINGNNSASDFMANYRLLSGQNLSAGSLGFTRELLFSGQTDDASVGQVMELTQSLASEPAGVQFAHQDFCLRCEFPGELRGLQLHELATSDFKFCPGAAPRFSASEPRIGLTLAIVIIGALFCLIIVVIVMYRKKSNAYYTNEDQDQLEKSVGGRRPVMSVSSEAEHQYADQTDYSSPPMSQSYESYSNDENEEEDEEEEEEEEEMDEELDEEDDEPDEEEQVAAASLASGERQTAVKRLGESLESKEAQPRPVKAPSGGQAEWSGGRQMSSSSKSGQPDKAGWPERQLSGGSRRPASGHSFSIERPPEPALSRQPSGAQDSQSNHVAYRRGGLEPALAISQRRQSSLERSFASAEGGGRRRLAVRSSQTVDPAGLAQLSSSNSRPGSLRQPSGRRQPLSNQLGRQRFALSKEQSNGGQLQSGASSPKEAAYGSPGSGEVSDATTADSLALEFMGEEPAAPQVQLDEEEELAELEASGLLLEVDELVRLRSPEGASLGGEQLRHSTHSNHSALTQTSSQDGGY